MKTLLSLAALALTLSACSDNDDANKADDGASLATPQQGAAPSMKLDTFMSTLPAAACTTITTCKQEKYAGTVGMMVMMTAAFGSLDDKDAQARIQAVGDTMKADKRFLLNQDECLTTIGYAFKAAKLTTTNVQADLDNGKVEFNGERAAACIETLKKSPDFCGIQVKLESELTMRDVGPISKEVEPMLDAYLKGCDGVISGKLADGAACEVDYQCAGESKCTKQECVGAAPVEAAEAADPAESAGPAGE